MNKVVIGKREIQDRFFAHESLGEVFKQIELDLQKQGQIVCRFMVNGLTLAEEDEARFSSFKLNDVEMIEVESESPNLLLTKVIANWISSLPNMIEKSDRLANEIRLKGMDNHISLFVDLVDSCQFLVDSLISLRTLCREIDFVSSESWKKNETQMAQTISETLNAFQKKDFVLLADIIEYDLGHCLQSWLETMKELGHHVQHQEAALSLG